TRVENRTLTVENKSGLRLLWNMLRRSANGWNLSDQDTAKLRPGTRFTFYQVPRQQEGDGAPTVGDVGPVALRRRRAAAALFPFAVWRPRLYHLRRSTGPPEPRRLNTMISPDYNFTLLAAFGINNKGQIVGVGVGRSGPQAFLLTPTD